MATNATAGAVSSTQAASAWTRRSSRCHSPSATKAIVATRGTPASPNATSVTRLTRPVQNPAGTSCEESSTTP